MEITRHSLGTNSTRVPKLAYDYITNSKRNIGRPRKGWWGSIMRKTEQAWNSFYPTAVAGAAHDDTHGTSLLGVLYMIYTCVKCSCRKLSMPRAEQSHCHGLAWSVRRRRLVLFDSACRADALSPIMLLWSNSSTCDEARRTKITNSGGGN